MKIAVSGASGWIGRAVAQSFVNEGAEVLSLSRSGQAEVLGELVLWDWQNGVLDASRLEGCDVVIHLAGESIAQRWTEPAMRRIRESRVQGTKFLCEKLAALERPPRLLISASAIGYYGANCPHLVTEESEAGEGFLAEVCQEWEEACRPASEAGISLVHLRLGLVLGANGGALGKMLPAFRLGLGGRLGSGEQQMSWISLKDLVRLIHHLVPRAGEDEIFSGVINAVAPEVVSQGEFAKCLGRELHRPAVLPVPSFVLRSIFGQMADETLLADQKVSSVVLPRLGFTFQQGTLASALEEILRP